MVLVRPRPWWFNKIPLSVMLVLLLLDGRRTSLGALAVLALVVLTVCAAANYGYAVNELFDVDEDARMGRSNAVERTGRRRMRAIAGGSALCTELFAAGAAGLAGAALALFEIALPLAYSVPPLRIKERRWLGVAADALAAHVFPAVLALFAVAHWALRPVTLALAICVVLWSAAAGVRGILSHQLHTAEQDRQANLTTVVHVHGRERLERWIVAVVVPVEVAAFGGALVACGCGLVLWIAVALYVVYEGAKMRSGRFRVIAFRREGQPYLPFLEESFYKAWGPLALALDAARVDPLYLLLVPAYALAFRVHVDAEARRIGILLSPLRFSRARARGGRSSEGS